MSGHHTLSRIYGSGVEKHLKNKKIFQPVFRKEPANKLESESLKIMNHETPETKVKHLLDKAFEHTKSHKNHRKTLNDIDHSIPASHGQTTTSSQLSLNPIVSAKISGEVSQQPKKRKKKNSIEKEEGQKKKSKKRVKKVSIFDNY